MRITYENPGLFPPNMRTLTTGEISLLLLMSNDGTQKCPDVIKSHSWLQAGTRQVPTLFNPGRKTFPPQRNQAKPGLNSVFKGILQLATLAVHQRAKHPSAIGLNKPSQFIDARVRAYRFGNKAGDMEPKSVSSGNLESIYPNGFQCR
jgi:hypothetical protein